MPEEATAYQMYETVSEGTPLTPPCESKGAVVNYLVEHGDFWGNTWTRSAAERFVQDEWAPSAVASGTKVYRPGEMGAEVFSKDGGRMEGSDE